MTKSKHKAKQTGATVSALYNQDNKPDGATFSKIATCEKLIAYMGGRVGYVGEAMSLSDLMDVYSRLMVHLIASEEYNTATIKMIFDAGKSIERLTKLKLETDKTDESDSSVVLNVSPMSLE